MSKQIDPETAEVLNDPEAMRRLRAGEWSTVRADQVDRTDEQIRTELIELGFLDPDDE